MNRNFPNGDFPLIRDGFPFELMDEVLDQLDQGLCVFDAEERLVLVNRAFRRLLGLRGNELRFGTSLETLAFGAGRRSGKRGEGRAILKRCLLEARKGRPKRFEHCPRGDIVLEIACRPLARGGFVLLCRDLTRERRAERTAHHVEKRYREAIEAMDGGFVLFDAEDRYVLWNSQYIEMNPGVADLIRPGVPFAEILRANVMRGVLPEAVGREEEYLAERLRLHRMAPGSREYRLADGRWIRAVERRTADGGIVGVRIDITALKRREIELAEKSALLEAILENMGQGLCAVDADMRFIAFNELFFELNALPPGRFRLGDSFEEFIRYLAYRGDFGGDDPEQVFRTRMAIIRRSGSYRFERTRPDGRIIEFRGNPMPGGGFIRIYTDVTEHRRAERALRLAKQRAEQANRAKSELMTHVSHDLRTPLNAILGFSDLLAKRLAELGVEARELGYVENIRSGGMHLLELVNDILDISRIEAGEYGLERESTDLRSVIGECVTLLRADAERKGLRLEERLQADLPPLFADRRALKQILLNLLSNAIKFTPSDGRIVIAAEQSSGELRVTVSDTGVGIRKEDLPRVKEPFERGRTDPYVRPDGTGLGLAIAHSLVKLHAGELDIESEVGKGTTVTVRLPQNPAP